MSDPGKLSHRQLRAMSIALVDAYPGLVPAQHHGLFRRYYAYTAAVSVETTRELHAVLVSLVLTHADDSSDASAACVAEALALIEQLQLLRSDEVDIVVAPHPGIVALLSK